MNKARDWKSYTEEHAQVGGFTIRETKVQRLLRTCGVRMTALYLKNRGYTPEQAITLMFR